MQTQVSESYRMCRRHKYFKKSDNTQIISQKGVTDSTEVLINQECATIRIEFVSYLNMRPFLVGQLTKGERQRHIRGQGKRAQIQVKWAFRNYCTYVQRGRCGEWGVEFINCSLRMLMTDKLTIVGASAYTLRTPGGNHLPVAIAVGVGMFEIFVFFCFC